MRWFFYHSTIVSSIESKDFNFFLFWSKFGCIRRIRRVCQNISTTYEDSIRSIFHIISEPQENKMQLKFVTCPTGKYHSPYYHYALNELNLPLTQKKLALQEKNWRSFLSILDRMQWAKKPYHATVSLCRVVANLILLGFMRNTSQPKGKV